MRIVRNKWIWIALAVVAVGGAAFFLFQQRDDVSYVTEVVKRESITQTVDANGEVVSVDEVDLSFDLSGTIEEVLVRVGDAVGVDDLLATLDSSELAADVQAAYQAMQSALGNLNRERAGKSDETLAVSDSSVDVATASFVSSQVEAQNAQAFVDAAVSRYQADIDVRESAVETAKDNLNQIISENAVDVSDAYDDLLSAAWACIIELRNSVAKSDEILGVRNGTLNDEYETNLSARNSAVKERAITAFYQAETSRDLAETAILSVDYGSSINILTVAQKTQDAANDAARLLLYVRQVADATPTGGDFSTSDLTTLLSSVDTARAALQVDQAALQNAHQAIQEVLRSSAQNLEDAKNALAEVESSLAAAKKLSDYQVTSAKQSVASAQALVDLRQAELAKALASRNEVAAVPRNVDIASYEAEVERARAAYVSAQARLEKAQMRSPIAGNVTNVDVEIGEQVVASDAIITVQTTEQQFKIVADVSESDISKISLGDEVELAFDAFGSEARLYGSVGKIDPAEKMIESVVYYEVTVYLDQEQQSLALRPGLSVDLVITTDARENALTVAQRSVALEGDKRYVQVLVDGKQQQREVVTGLRGDVGRLEIISGLNEGDEVIIRELNE